MTECMAETTTITIDDEIDIIFHHIDSLYWKQDFHTIDLILSQANPTMELGILVGFLTITLPHKEVFKYRPRIVSIIKALDDRPGLVRGLE